MKRTALKRKTSLRRTSRLKQASPKRAKALREYAKLRDVYMENHPKCEHPCCHYKSSELHHRNGRGVNLCEVKYFTALCSMHHRWVHEHPNKARELGLLK